MSETNQPHRDQLTSVRETLIGITIAFTLAFVFRGFVIEGFVIPTGSMAPTLLGKHVHVHDPATGYDWNVGPWKYVPNTQNPLTDQGEVAVIDPMTGKDVVESGQQLRWGDRVFVLKYMPFLNTPHRWDVVVFKNPATEENYIKRMVGLPNEQLALVDGDVFTRPFSGDKATAPKGLAAWELDDWTIQRKPERVQRELWQPLSDTRYAPVTPGPGDTLPWLPTGSWEGLRGESLTGTLRLASAAGSLRWDSAARPIDDWNPYNEDRLNARRTAHRAMGQPGGTPLTQPVSDVALTVVVQPDTPSGTISPVLAARGYEFRARLGAGVAALEMRPAPPAEGPDTAWTTLDAVKGGYTFDPTRPTRVEFWHVDQALWLFVDGALVAGGPDKGGYDLTPAQRLAAATGRDPAELDADTTYGDPRINQSILADPSIYRRPSVRLDAAGGPMTVHRIRLARDLHYHVSAYTATRGTHPRYFPTLGPDQFFMCGDNSPASLDGRLWRRGGPTSGEPDPWIADQIEDELGVVHRDLLLGRAFIVYFPAPFKVGPAPVPDLGRVRWIW